MMNTVNIWMEQMNELKEMCNALIAKEKAQKTIHRIILPNKFGYTKDINAREIAYEEARKAANRIVKPNKK